METHQICPILKIQNIPWDRHLHFHLFHQVGLADPKKMEQKNHKSRSLIKKETLGQFLKYNQKLNINLSYNFKMKIKIQKLSYKNTYKNWLHVVKSYIYTYKEHVGFVARTHRADCTTMSPGCILMGNYCPSPWAFSHLLWDPQIKWYINGSGSFYFQNKPSSALHHFLMCMVIPKINSQ